MTLFVSPRQTEPNLNGIIAAGWKYRFYEPGTSTPKTVYSDKDFLTSVGVFLEADGNGRFPIGYINGICKVRLEDEDGTEQWTVDNYDPFAGLQAAIRRADGVIAIDTIVGLKAFSTTGFIGGEILHLTEKTSGSADGYPVAFRAGDKSAQVAADTSDEWIVPNDRASDGSAGAWQRTLVEIAPISDSETSASKVWSSEKIAAELLDAVDDAVAESASASSAQAELAEEYALQAAANGHIYASTTAAQSNGVNSLASLVAGSGGTDGTFDLIFTGGAGSNAAGRFTVASGAVVSTIITNPGTGYTSAPTVDFSNSSGLSGASATAVLAQNRPSGTYYLIPLSTGNGAARYYLNNSGTPYTEDDWVLPSLDNIQALFSNYWVDSSKIPLFKFLDGGVPVWLENKKLGAYGLTPQLLSIIESYLGGLGVIMTEGAAGYPDFSILTADGKVIFRYQDGYAYFYGKTPNAAVEVSARRPVGSDLYAYKTGIAKLLDSAIVTVKLALTGDSWRERWVIPQRIADRLYAVYGQGADGWISVSSTDDAENLTSRKPLNGVTVARTNFTLVDISADAKTGLFGPDGHRIDCTTATGTITITGIRAETLKGYYLDTDGTWEYRIDGGSWVAVNEAGSGNTSEIEISGLSTASTHTLEIRTTGNTGTVTFYGFYATGISGIEVSKMANSGATAPQYASIVDDESVHYILQDIGVDLVEVCLGTNDFNQGVGLASYRSGLESLGSAYKSARTETGIVITSPPACNAAGSYPMSSYRDRAADAAKTLKCEHFDQFSLFASFDVMNNLGLWADGYHLNFIGGRFTTEELVSEYLIPF